MLGRQGYRAQQRENDETRVAKQYIQADLLETWTSSVVGLRLRLRRRLRLRSSSEVVC